MAGKKLFMAVDLGTSFVKTGVYDLEGKLHAGASEAVKDERPGPGMFIQRGDMLYSSCAELPEKNRSGAGRGSRGRMRHGLYGPRWRAASAWTRRGEM